MSTPRFTRIVGTGSHLPPRRLTNADLVQQLAQRGIETSDEWIVERTGIRARHFVDARRLQHDGRPARQPGLDDHQRHLGDRQPERQQKGVAAGQLVPKRLRAQHADLAIDAMALRALVDAGEEAADAGGTAVGYIQR